MNLKLTKIEPAKKLEHDRYTVDFFYMDKVEGYYYFYVRDLHKTEINSRNINADEVIIADHEVIKFKMFDPMKATTEHLHINYLCYNDVYRRIPVSYPLYTTEDPSILFDVYDDSESADAVYRELFYGFHREEQTELITYDEDYESKEAFVAALASAYVDERKLYEDIKDKYNRGYVQLPGLYLESMSIDPNNNDGEFSQLDLTLRVVGSDDRTYVSLMVKYASTKEDGYDKYCFAYDDPMYGGQFLFSAYLDTDFYTREFLESVDGIYRTDDLSEIPECPFVPYVAVKDEYMIIDSEAIVYDSAHNAYAAKYLATYMESDSAYAVYERSKYTQAVKESKHISETLNKDPRYELCNKMPGIINLTPYSYIAVQYIDGAFVIIGINNIAAPIGKKYANIFFDYKDAVAYCNKMNADLQDRLCYSPSSATDSNSTKPSVFHETVGVYAGHTSGAVKDVEHLEDYPSDNTLHEIISVEYDTYKANGHKYSLYTLHVREDSNVDPWYIKKIYIVQLLDKELDSSIYITANYRAMLVDHYYMATNTVQTFKLVLEPRDHKWIHDHLLNFYIHSEESRLDDSYDRRHQDILKMKASYLVNKKHRVLIPYYITLKNDGAKYLEPAFLKTKDTKEIVHFAVDDYTPGVNHPLYPQREYKENELYAVSIPTDDKTASFCISYYVVVRIGTDYEIGGNSFFDVVKLKTVEPLKKGFANVYSNYGQACRAAEYLNEVFELSENWTMIREGITINIEKGRAKYES